MQFTKFLLSKPKTIDIKQAAKAAVIDKPGERDPRKPTVSEMSVRADTLDFDIEDLQEKTIEVLHGEKKKK